MRNKLSSITSNDGRFHDGNPSRGELGTVVTAQWLNNVQDNVQDFFDELNNVLGLARLSPNAAKKNQLAEAIGQFLQSKLTADTGVGSPNLAFSAAGAKTLAQRIAQNQQAIAGLNSGKVDKTAISNAVNSTSQTNVGSSLAVKTAYDKGVEAKNAADAAQRTANAKQSPATTLAGYGITDGVMVKGAQNVNLNQLLNQSAVWSVTGVNKDTAGFNEKDIYNFGVGLTLASGPSAGMLYMPHATTKPKLYLKSHYNSYSPSPWAEVAMVDDVVRRTGETMTGPLGINRLSSYFFGQHNGVNNWYVGKGSDNSNDIRLHSYMYDHGVVIKEERIESKQPFYVGTNRVPHAGDSYMNLTSSNYGGITIQRPDRNDKMLMESNGEGFAFIRRNRTTNQNHYVVSMPAKSGTLLLEGDLGAKTKALVSRRDYSRRINGTASGQTQNQMDIVGSVNIYPDGRIVQILHLKHFRDLWFELEDVAVGYHDGGARGYQIPLQLWTAMPTKVLSVQPQLVRSTHPTSSVTYAGGEAAEHVCAWDLRKQGASRDRVTINMSRFRGGQSEHIDMYVVVEGY